MITFSFPERPDLPCWNIEAAQAVELSVSPGNSALEAQLEINPGGPLYALIEDAELLGFRTFGDFLASRDGGAVPRECCFLEITELEVSLAALLYPPPPPPSPLEDIQPYRHQIAFLIRLHAELSP